MIVSLPPTVASAEYEVVEVRRNAVFAGRLGNRVSEDIIVRQGESRILVHIAGSYHTMAVREGSRLHVGDTVTIRGDLVGKETTIARDRVRKVKP